MDLTIRHLIKTDSTNLEAKRAAISGAPEGLCVIADCQSAGIGRLGRSFFSPEGTGLYMSLVLRPRGTPQPQLITCAAAAAVCAALEKRGFAPGIKWVNDILIDSKKVCGILAQGLFDGKSQAAVLGIGVNLSLPDGGFPDGLGNIAGALYESRNEVPEGLRDALAGDILENFAALYEGESEKTAREYIKRSLMKNRPVTVITPDGHFDATSLGVNGDLSLSVVTDGGEKLVLASGEVSLRLK
ncbi:MAG: biotin--[Clostridia bacterium]|nr:biotin--[acetyl-CoA-carboxylase] ligase [Clostridia bacterium]